MPSASSEPRSRRRAPTRVVALLATLIAASAAHPHQGPVSGVAPFVVDGALVGGASTWGIVLADGDRFLRVCEEAFGERPTFHVMTSDGRILLGGSTGVFVTVDGGCSYAPLAGLPDGIATHALVVAAADRNRMVLVTATEVFRSDDEGRTFVAKGEIPDVAVLREAAISPDGVHVVVTGLDVVSGTPVLAVSDDGGDTFARSVRTDVARLIALAVDDDGQALLSAIPSSGPGALELRAADGATTVLASFDGSVTDGVWFDGRPRVIVGKLSYQSPDDAGVFAPVLGGPTGCLARPPGADALWGCGRLADFFHFLSSDDGLAFTGALPYGLVEDRVCPSGTAGRERCAFTDGGILLDGGRPRVDAGDGDGDDDAGPDPPPPTTCGCAATGPDRAPLLVLSALVLVARLGRRRPLSGR